MQPLWAPWRMAYIDEAPPDGCIFCTFPNDTTPGAARRHRLLARTDEAFVILNRYPYNPGHLMVIPHRHGGSLVALSGDEFQGLHALLKIAVEAVTSAYAPEGLNVGMNLGQAGGAGITDHLHYHVVPRFLGDSNFMPLLAETKVVNEHLDASWERLQPIFASMVGSTLPGI